MSQVDAGQYLGGPAEPGKVARFFLTGGTPHRVECAWCQEIMRGGCEPVSHSICAPCRAVFFQGVADRVVYRPGGLGR